ncbi:MAG: YitT family protein [Lachnospiraceae bacterium]|nr:YitT family protein [Lachnospiraceae bacterium]
MSAFFAKRSTLRDYLLILTGTFLMGVAINFIYEPMELVTGGVTGLGIIIKHFTAGKIDIGGDGIAVWITNLVFNIPVFLISLRVFGFRYIAKTLFATLALSGFLAVLPIFPLFESDYILSVIFGGLLSGAGIGLVLLTMATTGGTDMLGMLIRHKNPHLTVPQIIFVLDGLIVLTGAVVFGIKAALYATIAVYITSKVSDNLLDGLKFAKCAYIISDLADDIADEILVELDRGVTGLNGEGMFSHLDKKVLYCVVSRKEMVRVLDIVYKHDPTAFVTISDVREVWGEGYGELKRRKN